LKKGQFSGQEVLKILQPEEVVEVDAHADDNDSAVEVDAEDNDSAVQVTKKPGSCVDDIEKVAMPGIGHDDVMRDVPLASTAEEEDIIIETEEAFVDASPPRVLLISGGQIYYVQASITRSTEVQSHAPRSKKRKLKAAIKSSPPIETRLPIETLRRSTRNRRLVLAMKANTDDHDDPTTYVEAVRHESWKQAIREEFASLHSNKAWTY